MLGLVSIRATGPGLGNPKMLDDAKEFDSLVTAVTYMLSGPPICASFLRREFAMPAFFKPSLCRFSCFAGFPWQAPNAVSDKRD